MTSENQNAVTPEPAPTKNGVSGSGSPHCSLPSPFYDKDGITIYCGRCEDIVPSIQFDMILTDPPYPNDPRFPWTWEEMSKAAWVLYNQAPENCWLVTDFSRVQLPRWLEAWQPWEYCDMLAAYVSNSMANCAFGIDCFTPSLVFRKGAPKVAARQRNVIEVTRGRLDKQPVKYPAAKYEKVYRTALVMFGATVALDPFMGSGTALRAAKDVGIKSVGIDTSQRACEIAEKRLAQGVLF